MNLKASESKPKKNRRTLYFILTMIAFIGSLPFILPQEQTKKNNPVAAPENLQLSIIQRVLFAFAKPLFIEKMQGPFLIISPHPDDETLGCAAAIMRARGAGKQVFVIIITNGAASSHPILTSEELIVERRKEAEQACSILGVAREDIFFFSFSDGRASEHVNDITSELQKYIQRLKPKEIFSPYGDDEHDDHQAIAAAIDLLVNNGIIKVPVYEYPIWFWPWRAQKNAVNPFRLARLRIISTAGLIEPKKKALMAYKSQSIHWNDNYLRYYLQSYEIFFEKKQ